MVRDTDNLHFSADMQHILFEGRLLKAWKARLLLYVRRRRFRFYSPPLMNVVSARKATVDCCTALIVTLTPSLIFQYVCTSLKP